MTDDKKIDIGFALIITAIIALSAIMVFIFHDPSYLWLLVLCFLVKQ